MSIVSMSAYDTPQPPPRGYRVGWDFNTKQFVVYKDDAEVARLTQRSSNTLLEEIKNSK